MMVTCVGKASHLIEADQLTVLLITNTHSRPLCPHTPTIRPIDLWCFVIWPYGMTDTIHTIGAGRREVQYRGADGLRGGWQVVYLRHRVGSPKGVECLAGAVMDLGSPTVTLPSSMHACSGRSTFVEMHCP